MTATIWHHPRCSKSRAVLAALHEAGVDVTVIDYLRDAPTREEIAAMIAASGLTPRTAMRRDAPIWPDDDAALDAMATDPSLIERPFVRTDKGARLCRPTERVAELL